MARWLLVDKKWIPADKHTPPEPSKKSGFPTAFKLGWVKHPIKVSDAEIRAEEREEEERLKNIDDKCGIEACFKKAEEQMKSGEVRVDERITHAFQPTKIIEDGRGITHILPAD